MSYSSAKASAERLARQLGDAHPPKCCPICLEVAAHSFCRDFIEHFPPLRIEVPALFDACIATLTSRRTPEGICLLQNTLVTNHQLCATHGDAHGLPRRPDPVLDLRSLIESAGHIFCTAIDLGERPPRVRAAQANKAFADKQGRWPVRLEQLFPDGVAAAVDALLAYCELYVSTVPIDVLTGMIVIARPAVLSVLFLDTFRPRVVDVALKMLDPVASGIVDRAPWLLENQLSFKSVSHLFGMLIVGPGGLPRDLTALFVGYEGDLLRVLAPVTERMIDDGGGLMLHPYSSWCAKLAKQQNVALSPRIAQWVETWRASYVREWPLAHVFYELVSLLMGSRVCSGPECTVSVLQNEGGKPFPACARCRVPRYCSRACQRRDWKGDGALVAHKRVCGVLGKLGAHACRTFTRDQFQEVYARTEPLLDDADRKAISTFLSSMSKIIEP